VISKPSRIGTPEEIYQRPASRFVADFIGDANFLAVAQEPAAPRGDVKETANGALGALEGEGFEDLADHANEDDLGSDERFADEDGGDTGQGEGQVVGSPCRECRGNGRVQSSKKIEIKIPAGVDRGQQIRLAGEGEIGPKGGPSGDLYVVLDVQEHAYFTRDGIDILYELPLNVAQAALGDEVKIPTLDGEVELRIPPGTQHGQSFRLRGKGVPRLRSTDRGSMFVVARVVTPSKLTHRQRELFEELSRELGNPEDEKGFFDKLKEKLG